MANIKSSKKRIKVAETKRLQNKAQKSELSTYTKKFKAAPTAEGYNRVVSLLDKAAQDNVIHANKAARHKSKLAKLVPAA
ncbi:MAG: 30S ribosomal protein S20 [Firmicutes bacterium]|nr:30S ribosomal protein S20 [Bacillota bacterium]